MIAASDSALSQGTSSESFAEQLVLIKALAPYFRQLDSRDTGTFFERLFDLWFIRWRLKLQDFGGQISRLNKGMRRQMEVWLLRSAAYQCN